MTVTAGSGRTYVTEIIRDEYGHITGYKTATETDQEIPDAPDAPTVSEGPKIDVEFKDNNYKVSHETIAAPTKRAGGSGREYITELISDDYGHIIGYKTSTEVDQEIPEVIHPDVLEGTYINIEHDESGNHIIHHEDAPALTVTNKDTEGSRFVKEITRDDQGHITGYTTEIVNIPDVTLDEVSINRNTAGEIQMKDFAEATTVAGNIPRVVVKDGKKTIEWVTVKEAVSDIKDENTVTTVEAGNDGVEVELISQTADEIKYEVSHADAPTTGNAAADTAGVQGTYVTEVLVDEFGHVAGVKTAVDKDTKYDLKLGETATDNNGVAS
jgi:hypothetical protein